MAYLNTTSAPSISARISGFAADVMARYRRHQLYRETLNGLSALSNHELADLGLHRCQLRRIAAEASQR